MMETAECHCLIFLGTSYTPGRRMGRAAPSAQPAKAMSTASRMEPGSQLKNHREHLSLLPDTPLWFLVPSNGLANTYLLVTGQPWWTFGHTEEKKAAPALLLYHPRKTGGQSKLTTTG